MCTQAVQKPGSITVALAQSLTPGTPALVRIGETAIAIFDVDGVVHAIDDTCMRCGASLMAATRQGARIACACGWAYDLASGAVEGMPSLRLDKFDVRRVGDAIEVGYASPSPQRPSDPVDEPGGSARTERLRGPSGESR
jgi:nitrite reductase/ring-hydroxylating ferredoxin subunit